MRRLIFAAIAALLPGVALAQPQPGLTVTVGQTPLIGATNGNVLSASSGKVGQTSPTITINGTSCTLAGSCTVSAASTGVTVGSTTVSSGTSGRVLYDNAGVLGELATTGTGSVVLGSGPTITLGSATGLPLSTGVTGTLGLSNGGTGADLSATGGTSQVLKQVSSGAAVTVGQLAASDLSNGTTGSGSVVLATSPTLTTPALGTPSALNLSNATALPCAAMPALTGAVTTSAGSCVTSNAAGQKTKGVSWDSGTTVTAATTPLYSPTISGTIDSVTYYTNGSGSPSFSISITINGTDVTSCNGLTVNSSSVTTTTCTGANTFAGGDKIAVVTSSISGTPQQALVQINYH